MPQGDGPTPPDASIARRARLLDAAAGFLAVGIALATKVPIALSRSGLHGDDAIVVLVAKHIAEGCGIPPYLYGFALQQGAVLNAYLMAPVYALFGGNPNRLTLVVQVVTILLAYSSYRLILRREGRWTALAGSLCLTAALPVVSLHLLWADHHDWGLLFMLWQLGLFFRIHLDRSDRVADMVLFGAVSALAFRVSGATAVLSAVSAGFLLLECRSRRALRKGIVWGGATGAGVLAGLVSLGGFEATARLFRETPGGGGGGDGLGGVLTRLGLLGERLRISFRLSLGGSLGRYVLLDDLLIVLVLAALGLALARLLRRSRAETAGWGVRHDSFLIAYVMAFFFVYAASPWSRGKGDSAEPAKYLMYTYPAFVLLGARHFRSLATWLRAVVLASMAGAAVLTYTLVSFPLDPSRTVQSTIDFLLFRGLTRVYAEYNLAWPLMAYSGERIVAANLDGQPYRPWAEAVWGASRVALVHDVGYGVADLVRRELNREGARFDTWRAGSVVVFYDFDRDPRPIVARATGRDPTTEEWVAPDPDRYLASRDCIRDPPWREDPPGSRESPATGKNR